MYHNFGNDKKKMFFPMYYFQHGIYEVPVQVLVSYANQRGRKCEDVIILVIVLQVQIASEDSN